MIFAAAFLAVAAAPPASPSPEDRRNIALSTAIVAHVGDRLWPNWSKTPFAIDLLTAAGPVAINFPKPLAAPSFPRRLEATFPLANGVPTIVIGEPRFTAAKTPIRWSVILLHEHFHQWQDSWPQYQLAIEGLKLAPKGGGNGMWMLDYAFPYKDKRVERLYGVMGTRLATAVQAIGTARFRATATAYLSARSTFKSALRPNDYRYFAFQCWQEGTARYTEIAVARLAARAAEHDPEFIALGDANALARDSAATYGGVLQHLRSNSLGTDQRVEFYSLGAGEALLLDQIDPGWHKRYLDKRMDLGNYF